MAAVAEVSLEHDSVPAEDDPSVAHRGYAFKLGRFFKSWRKRYLVLFKSGVLAYYSSDKSKPSSFSKGRKKGSIIITGSSRIRRVRRHEEFYFFVVVDQRVFYVKALSLDGREAWVRAIQNCIDQSWERAVSVTGKSFIKSIDDLYVPDAESWALAELGSGNFGTVWRAKEKTTGTKLAIKSVLVRPQGGRAALKNEVELMTSLNHPNIVSLMNVHETSTHIYMVQELCTGGELFDAISMVGGKFNEHDAACIMKDALLAVHHCHDRNICHRDLKPENFLLATPVNPKRRADERFPTVKIIDFGVSTFLSQDSRASGLVGTIFYMAPEIFEKQYGIECDMWSLGVIMYVLLSGKLPFSGDTVKDVVQSIKAGFVDFSHSTWDEVSTKAMLLIKRMLTVESKDRITAEEALETTWIKTLGIIDDHLKHDLYDSWEGICAISTETKYWKRCSETIADELSIDKIYEVLELARAMDHDKSGILPKEIFFEFIRKSLKSETPLFDSHNTSGLNTLNDTIDKSESFQAQVSINYEDFVKSCLTTKQARTESLVDAIVADVDDKIDKDTGQIKPSDISDAFERQGRGSFLAKEIQGTFIKDDGEFDMEEFMGLMLDMGFYDNSVGEERDGGRGKIDDGEAAKMLVTVTDMGLFDDKIAGIVPRKDDHVGEERSKKEYQQQNRRD